MTPPAEPARYKNHRFPGEIISHEVWLYYRFTLSYRDVEELEIAPSSNPNALPSPILRRLSRTSHSRAAPCSAWFRGAPAGSRGALGARQSPRASMAVGGGVRPGGRSEKGRLDFLYVEVAVINELRCSKSRLREASL
jgi:hypothetical protein